jgi:hypothetical protein
MNRSRNLRRLKTDSCDLISLEKEAREADARESYRRIAGNDEFRVGVFITITEEGTPEYSLELLLCVLRNNSDVEISLLEGARAVGITLLERGYSVSHRDDGWMVAIKTVGPEVVDGEYERLMALLGAAYNEVERSSGPSSRSSSREDGEYYHSKL